MKLKVCLLIVVILAMFVVNTLYQAGVFLTLKPHSKLTDIKINTLMPGTEDMAIDKTNGLMYISSSNRWKLQPGENPNDAIYVMDLKSDNMPVKLITTYQGEFHPHGISFFSKDGIKYLFVVNHNQNGSSVEKFSINKTQLDHIKTYRNASSCCLNDVVAVDDNKFYLTNDHGSAKGMMRVFEDYLKIARSSVIYFNGVDYSTVYDNLNYANGLEISKDGKLFYVTETTGRKISVLDRDIVTGKLKLRFTQNLYSGLDNITIDQQGNLWIGAHPKLLDFVGHANSAENHSPSQVLKLTLTDNNIFKVEEIYLDDGSQLSGSSTALYYKNKVYVGVVFESKLLIGHY